MTSTLRHTTESKDRPCQAQNKLTCKFHGVAGEFTEVPQYVQDNADRLRSYREQTADAKASLTEFAATLGMKFRDIGYAIRIPGFTPEGATKPLDADAIATLKAMDDEYEDALAEEEEERSVQSSEVRNFVYTRLREEFPHYNNARRQQLEYLVGARYLGIENEWGDEADSKYKHDIGVDRQQLFANMNDPFIQGKLRELDRGYFTAVSGRIPSDEQLDAMDAERILRIRRQPNTQRTQVLFDLVGDMIAAD